MVAAQRILPVFRPEGVDVNGPVGGLRCNKLVQGIPCHALDVVAMFGDLSNKHAYNSQVSHCTI